ncbi:MAG: carboxylating nicotinate-nucleotide diphosphorylase [bacterium]|nr:carboxylating nicotinate-nucleotide diphosphorylase [bacterium]
MNKNIIQYFILEDAPQGDITSLAIFGQKKEIITAQMIAKESLVVSGFSVIKNIVKLRFPKVKLSVFKKDSSIVTKGTVIAKVKGPVTDILLMERLCLNLMQRLSGVATLTHAFVTIAKPHKVSILDTRKTTPGLRTEEKKAVVDGRGENHRMSLSDQYLIKDNHIDAAGGVLEAIEQVLKHQKQYRKKPLIEVEVRDEAEFCEALLMQVDVIMLDNMKPAQIKKLVKLRNQQGKKSLLEISGNVTLKNLKKYVTLGVERISVGALTHSARAVDISMVLGR